MRSFRLPALSLALLAVAALVACSSGGENAQSSQPAQSSPQASVGSQPEIAQALAPEVTTAKDGVIEVRIEAGRFLQNNLRLTPGGSVTIRVVNADSQPHNFRIAGPDGQYETEDDAVSQPAVLDAGSGGELEFSPALPGKYTFRCDFHPGSMGGQIEVAGG